MSAMFFAQTFAAAGVHLAATGVTFISDAAKWNVIHDAYLDYMLCRRE